jgi:hypothetical protein
MEVSAGEFGVSLLMCRGGFAFNGEYAPDGARACCCISGASVLGSWRDLEGGLEPGLDG